ncbi:MAG: hypothetical protein IPM35_22410 [Myxococcales bacterium]|nr:hypothetical protein [Myxococcales bacterium]
MRRWVASVLLIGLSLFAVTPARLPAWFASLRPASALSAPIPRNTELRAAQTAAPLAVEAPVFRADVASPPLAALVQSSGARSRVGSASALEPERRLPDQRESIRRVCRRKVPPDWPVPVASA